MPGGRLDAMTLPRALLMVLFVSVGAYANSVGNGFALDDVGIIRENPSVTEPTLGGVLEAPYWPDAPKGSGLYRPVVIGSYALQSWGFDGSSVGFHAVSVASHAAVSVLLMLVLAGFVPLVAALAGALLFAVHTVHVEAVANVVGQAERSDWDRRSSTPRWDAPTTRVWRVPGRPRHRAEQWPSHRSAERPAIACRPRRAYSPSDFLFVAVVAQGRRSK